MLHVGELALPNLCFRLPISGFVVTGASSPRPANLANVKVISQLRTAYILLSSRFLPWICQNFLLEKCFLISEVFFSERLIISSVVVFLSRRKALGGVFENLKILNGGRFRVVRCNSRLRTFNGCYADFNKPRRQEIIKECMLWRNYGKQVVHIKNSRKYLCIVNTWRKYPERLISYREE